MDADEDADEECAMDTDEAEADLEDKLTHHTPNEVEAEVPVHHHVTKIKEGLKGCVTCATKWDTWQRIATMPPTKN